MQIRPKFISGKKYTTYVILIAFVFQMMIGGLFQTQRTLANESTLDEGQQTEQVSQLKAKEILSYLKKIDTNKGRADFQAYLNDKVLDRDRLIRVRNNLSYQIAKLFHYQVSASSYVYPDFLDLERLEASAPESVTIADLIDRMQSEIHLSELLKRQAQSLQMVVTTLKASDPVQEIARLEQKLELETQLIDLLTQKASETLSSLASELRLENRLTEFWISYAGSSQSLIAQLETYLIEDLSFLSGKMELEQAALRHLNELYPTDEARSQLMDEYARNLFSLYYQQNVEQKIVKYVNDLLQSETILAIYQDEPALISTDLPLQMRSLEQLLDFALSGDFNSATFADEVKSLYSFLADKNHGDLSANYNYNSQFEVLRAVNTLINFASITSYQLDVTSIRGLYPVIVDYERDLKKAVQQQLDALIEDNVEITVEETETIVGTVEETETIVGTVEGTVEGTIVGTVEGTIVGAVEEPVVEPEEDEGVLDAIVGFVKDLISGEEEPVVEPVVEPVEEPVVETIEETIGGTIVELAEEPVEEEATEETIEAATEEAVGEATEESDDLKPAAESIEETIEEAIEEPVVETIEEAVGEIIEGTIEEPVEESVEATEETAEEPLEEAADTAETIEEAIEEVVEELVAEPVEETAEELVEEPVEEEATEETIEATTEEVAAEESVEEPVEGPTEGDSIAIEPETTEDSEPVETDDELEEDAFDVVLEPFIPEDEKLQTLIEESEIFIIPSEIAELMSLLEGDTLAFDEAVLINQLIEDNEDVNKVDEAILRLEKNQRYALLTQDIINDLITTQISLDEFISYSSALNLNIDQLDGLLSFLNQLTVELGYSDDAIQFNGINGIVRFSDEQCPDLTDSRLLDPQVEWDDFILLPFDQQRELMLVEQENETNSGYAKLKALRALDADFCVSQSSDISTKHLLGKADYFKENVEQSYVIDQENLSIEFKNTSDRFIQFDMSSPAGKHQFTLQDNPSDEVEIEDETDFLNEAEKQIEAQIVEAIGVGIDDTVIVEDVELVPEETRSEVLPLDFVMSALENPDYLFTPVEGSHTTSLDHMVAYEYSDHRRNIVDVFRDDSSSITPRRLDEYRIYNYGDGFEEERLRFEGIVLHPLADGSIEGYLEPEVQSDDLDFDVDEEIHSIYVDGLSVEPIFRIRPVFALDHLNQPIEGLTTRINGDRYNELLIALNASVDRYPFTVNARVTFTSPDQSAYDAVLDSGRNTVGRFGSSQTVGDFNADGVDDLAIGSFAHSSLSGLVSIYYGQKEAGFSSSLPEITLMGDSLDYFGYSLEAADLNADGIDDLVVGSPYHNLDTGKIWIYDGATLATKELSIEADLVIEGAGEGDEFGTRIALDDLNGDGFVDVAVSAPGDRNEQGLVHLFYDLNKTFDETISALNANDSDQVIVGEPFDAARFGQQMMAGDFNADSKADLIISSPYTLPNGRFYLFFQDEHSWTTDEEDCQKNCLATQADLMMEGEGEFAVSMTAGDFDGDGQLDLATGSPLFNIGQTLREGRVCVYYQDETPWTIQSEEPCSQCSALNADVKITGEAAELFGKTLHAFDMNQDQLDDLVVTGSFGRSPTSGKVTIFTSDLTADSLNIGTGGFMDSDTHYSLRWHGEAKSAFGQTVITGDFNGDGFDDLSIAAPRFLDDQGRLYIFNGTSPESDEEGEGRSLKQKLEDETIVEDEVIEEEVADAEEGEGEEVSETLEEEDTDFEIDPDDIEGALDEVKEAASDYLLDISIPEPPAIVCPGFIDGEFNILNYASCSWEDTAGPSIGIHKYCLDFENTCIPDIEKPGRLVDFVNLSHHHNYFRVQVSDEGGISDIASFNLAVDNMPIVVEGPSDGGVDENNPVNEGDLINFTVTAKDIEEDPYYLLVCRTSDAPIYNTAGEPVCIGAVENKYCSSKLTDSGEESFCSFDTGEQPSVISIWYAFVCEAQNGIGGCTSPSQGSEAEGSPFYVNYPARFGEVVVTDINNEAPEPGDYLRFRLPSAEITDVPPGSPVTLYVCSEESTGFDYRQNLCLNGTMLCQSDPTHTDSSDVICDEFQSNELLLTIPYPVQEQSFQVYAEHGEKGLVEGVHDQAFDVLNKLPRLVRLDNEGDISILPGGQVEVYFSAILEDDNGAADIISVEGVFYDNDAVWNDCEAHQNDCVIDPVCDLEVLSDIQIKADCSVSLFYNANASEYWMAHVNPSDTAGLFTDLQDSGETRTVPPLNAINQESISVPYVSAEPGQITDAVETPLINLGNQPVDVLISGTDLVSDVSVIQRHFQKWSLNKDFDYKSDGYHLVETPVVSSSPNQGCADLTLPVHEDTTHPDVTPLYWKMMVPESQKAELYTGSVYFEPAGNSCVDEVPIVLETIEESLEKFYEAAE